ncbi:hypothetical protein BGZ63DRAFT_402881 [Mariannaea sp. PMI_226]|nr:hypothetical protein BGZ63DRAFT_402881 [Mariannaea sp. PMI_226]
MSALRSIATARFASRTTLTRPAIPSLVVSHRRHLSQEQGQHPKGDKGGVNEDANVVDALAGGDAKGITGGGKRLGASSRNAAAKPKITNQSVPGWDASATLTEEQRREVEEHNRDFDAKHDHGNNAPDDKVDKKFWREDGRRR